MDSYHRPGRLSLCSLTIIATLAAVGCASPGLPRSPSLNLPEPARDLKATRIGSAVELRFTVPSRSTDKLPMRGAYLTARICRSLEKQPCHLLPSSPIVVPLNPTAERHTSYTWIDNLPEDLTRGQPRPLSYTVELLNLSGHSAGPSAPAFTAAGEPPAPVAGLRAEGSRLGILIRWNDSAQVPGEVLLQRENPGPPLDPKTPETIQLTAPPAISNSARASLLDTTVKPETPYRYTATRRLTVELSGRSIQLLSTPSSTLELTLKPIYPPPSPSGLTAAAFTSNAGIFSVDLIWQPINDAGLITPLAGYNIYRATTGNRSRLNPAPLTLPAFHDTTALPNTRYRYIVTSVDVKGNESPATGVDFGP
jgi:hypothetical protein